MAIYVLEERILFDAAAPSDADAADALSQSAEEPVIEAEPDRVESAGDSEETQESAKDESGESDGQSEADDEKQAEDSSKESVEGSSDAEESTDTPAESLADSPDESDDASLTVDESSDEDHHKIVFINDTLTDRDAIIEAMEEEEVEVIVVTSSESGFDVISETLEGREDIDAIHIFSHGGDGHFVLGTDVVDSGSLEENSEVFKSWASSLAEDADINLYGCKVAESDSGKDFVDRLAELTGADVAASTDNTGSPSTGGDWELEYTTGSVDSAISLAHAGTVSLLPTYTVNSLDDNNDGFWGNGHDTLREAIAIANGNIAADDIIFADGLNGTINLLLGELDITESLTINGDGRITINGNGTSRIFNIDDGDFFNNIDVALTDLTMQNGSTTGNGGAVRSLENLTINDCTITGNTAEFGGGGVYARSSYGSTITISDSIISGNTISRSVGGGVYAYAQDYGTVTISNSTISGNTASYGGGVFTRYFPYDSTVIISSTIIGNNTAKNSGDDLTGRHSFFNDVGNSLIESPDGHTITNGVDGNIVGFDPLLGPLADNGGPTQTHALLFGSPALNTGSNPDGLDTDQRGDGFPRDDGNGVDMGAYEDATDQGIVLEGDDIPVKEKEVSKKPYTPPPPAETPWLHVNEFGDFLDVLGREYASWSTFYHDLAAHYETADMLADFLDDLVLLFGEDRDFYIGWLWPILDSDPLFKSDPLFDELAGEMGLKLTAISTPVANPGNQELLLGLDENSDTDWYLGIEQRLKRHPAFESEVDKLLEGILA